jgi:hypothetical protein
MNKVRLLARLLSCLLISAVHAQTPKVVFTGDGFTYLWQQTSQFTANKNWIGAGINVGCCYGEGSKNVSDAFQTNVINQHPAFVHIVTGGSDASDARDAIPYGATWQQYAHAIMNMVGMAQKANIKVILGTLPTDTGAEPKGEDAWSTQDFNSWLENYGLTNNIPVVNYHDALCQCVGSTSPNDTFVAALGVPDPTAPVPYPYQIFVPNDAGYALITQMAQTAIQTYGLTIKGGYLSNVVNRYGIPSGACGCYGQPQTNHVPQGTILTFMPQATWSDGVTRPMLNSDMNGMKGIWWSTNTSVMQVNLQGQAIAYNPGVATIWFKSASGATFSPWTMTVEAVFPSL